MCDQVLELALFVAACMYLGRGQLTPRHSVAILAMYGQVIEGQDYPQPSPSGCMGYVHVRARILLAVGMHDGSRPFRYITAHPR